MCTINGAESGFNRGIEQERYHQAPITIVFGFLGKTNSEIICLVGPIQSIEPVARIVAIPVKRFRAEHIVSRMEKWNSLSQTNQRNTQIIDANAIIHRRFHRDSVLVNVKQSLVVVGRDVVNYV